MTEILVLFALALIFIGPKQLPEVARTLARLLNECRRATGDLIGVFSDTGKEVTHSLQKLDEDLKGHMTISQKLPNISDKTVTTSHREGSGE